MQTIIPPESVRPVANEGSSYSRFILMHFRGKRQPFLYEIFSSPLYRGVECALWPALYHTTSLCESILEGQDNRASGKIAFMRKLFSPVHDFSINFEILQYQYDRWLFKTITGAVNASKASGCCPIAAWKINHFQRPSGKLKTCISQMPCPNIVILHSSLQLVCMNGHFLFRLFSRKSDPVTSQRPRPLKLSTSHTSWNKSPFCRKLQSMAKKCIH